MSTTEATETTKLKLSLMIDKRANKVLFAEAESDFVNFLFNLLSLPIGTVINLFRNESMFGCIENLYQSLENFNAAYLQPDKNKSQLLKPHLAVSSVNPPLLLAEANSQSQDTKYIYFCMGRYHSNMTDVAGIDCPECLCTMDHSLQFVDSNSCKTIKSIEGGIVQNLVTYLVTDDLLVTPMSMITGIDLLQHNVKDVCVLEKRVVEFGTKEGLELLKYSLKSKTALTNVFLAQTNIKDVAVSNSS
ncbi:hypothetical protein KPL71_011419 [Citrus sinensis]|uniref:Uncharacterized protein n=1 Tax=Citrus sinensis TaxID=2711 RepID=A0ACB8L329_CITSI|nr:hypothetical protein KPL71_011419 [Citrus sinensis]